MKTDAELLREFVAERSEAAFAELASRHGPAVYRVCLAVLGDPHDAEDGAQATFLVLVRKAAGLGRAEGLSAWLQEIARRVCRESRRAGARRARREEEAVMRQVAAGDRGTGQPEDRAATLAAVQDELAALGRAEREAVTLRYLENRTQEEAAELAGVPRGTLARRASDGLERLRSRLARRGVGLSAAALAALFASLAQAPIPETLLPSILAVPRLAAAGVAAGGAGGTLAVSLAEGVMKAMFYAQLKLVGATVAAAAALAVVTPLAVQAVAGGGSGPVQAGAVDNVIKGKVTAVEGEAATIDVGRKDGVREGFEFGCEEKGWAGKVTSVAEDRATLKLTAEASKAAVGDLVRTRFTVVLAGRPQPGTPSPAAGPAPAPAVPEAVNGIQLTLTGKELVGGRSVYVNKEGKEVRARTDAGFDDARLPDGVVKKHLKITLCELQADIKNVSDKPVTFIADPSGLCFMRERDPATGKVAEPVRQTWHPEAAQDPKTGWVIPKGAVQPGLTFVKVDLATAKPSPALDTYSVTLQPGETRAVARLTLGREANRLMISMVIDCGLSKELAESYWHGRIVTKEVEWKKDRSEEVAAP